MHDVGDILFQYIDNRVDPNCWMPTLRTRHMRHLLSYLNKLNVQCHSFWMPMNQLKMFQQEIFISQENISSQLYNSCISIPCSSGLKINQQQEVIEKIKSFFVSN